MTSQQEWHLDDDLLSGYVHGTVDAARGSSVEQHVVRCAACRTALNALAAGAEPHRRVVEDVWTRVRDVAQARRASLVERLLVRLGLPADEALLLWSAPAFRTPWLASTLVTLAFATLAASVSDDRGVLLFLVVAPLLPVAGVALAYGPDADPAFEVSTATPFSSLRLLLLRTTAVLATTVPLTVVAGLVLPADDLAVAWLAPSLAAVAATLAGSTWTTVARAAALVACLWTVSVVVVAGPDLAVPAPAFAPSRIPVYALVVVISLVVVRVRGSHLNQLGDPS